MKYDDFGYFLTTRTMLGELKSGDEFTFLGAPPVSKDFLRPDSMRAPIGHKGKVAEESHKIANATIPVYLDNGTKLYYFHCQCSVLKEE